MLSKKEIKEKIAIMEELISSARYEATKRAYREWLKAYKYMLKNYDLETITQLLKEPPCDWYTAIVTVLEIK